MPEQRPLEPADINRPDDARLPLPAGDRKAMIPHDSAELARRTFAAGPVLAASLLGTAAAAAVTGAAVAARLLWPWAMAGWRDVVPSTQPETSGTRWLGPGVHVSYTHVEIHWPAER